MHESWKEAFETLFEQEVDRVKSVNKGLKIELKLLRSQYDKEITSPSDLSTTCSDRSVKEYLCRLEDVNKLSSEMVNNLQKQLDFKTKELEDLKNKIQQAEQQSRFYKRAIEEVDKSIPYHGDRNLSSIISDRSLESSIVSYSIPSPPPIEVPSMDELLTSTYFSNDDSNFATTTNSISSIGLQFQPDFIR